MKVNFIDLVVPVIILWELLMGLRRGLSGELFRLLGTCLVFAIGLRFYEDFGLMIANHSRLAQNQEMAVALAFLLILVGMGVCFFIMRIVLVLLVNVKFNDAIDRPAGGLAGGLNGCLIAVLLVFAAGLWPNAELQPLITVDSYVGKTVFKIVPIVKEKIRSLPIRLQQSPSQPEPPGPACSPVPERPLPSSLADPSHLGQAGAGGRDKSGRPVNTLPRAGLIPPVPKPQGRRSFRVNKKNNHKVEPQEK